MCSDIQQVIDRLTTLLIEQGRKSASGEVMILDALHVRGCVEAALSSPSVPAPSLREYVQHTPTCLKGKPVEACPHCGCQLKRVRRGANSMLNEYQFDAVKVGDFYCDACRGTEAEGSAYKYWWTRELAASGCTCGLGALLAASAPAPQEEEQEKELLISGAATHESEGQNQQRPATGDRGERE